MGFSWRYFKMKLDTIVIRGLKDFRIGINNFVSDNSSIHYLDIHLGFVSLYFNL
jgi:hypothetical protein